MILNDKELALLESNKGKLALACLHRLRDCNLNNQAQRDRASLDIQSTLEKIDGVVATITGAPKS